MFLGVSKKQWLVAILTAGATLALLTFYLFLRRGYINLYIVNKVLGNASLVLLAVVLLLGPLSRLYQRFDSWVLYRKELGILAFVAAILHALISFFVLSERFTLKYYLQGHLVPFLLGLAGVAVLTALFILSFEKIIAFVGRERWWRWQYWGVRLVGLFALLHLIILKYPGWVSWLSRGGSDELLRPFIPPASLMVGLLGIFVLLVRLSEFLGVKVARLLTALLLIVLLAGWAGFYLQGIARTPVLHP